MKKAGRKVKASKRAPARKATVKAPKSALSLPSDLSKQIDAWAGLQKDSPDRVEAIRRLLVAGLKAERSKRPLSEKAAAKASELAAQTLDTLADASATDEERALRKRKLLKGPKEFRS